MEYINRYERRLSVELEIKDETIGGCVHPAADAAAPRRFPQPS